MYFSLPLLLNSSVKFLIISSLNFSLLFSFYIIFFHRSSKCVQAAYCGSPHYTKQHWINYASHREIMRCFALYHSFIVSFEFYVPAFYGHFSITSFFSLPLIVVVVFTASPFRFVSSFISIISIIRNRSVALPYVLLITYSKLHPLLSRKRIHTTQYDILSNDITSKWTIATGQTQHHSGPSFSFIFRFFFFFFSSLYWVFIFFPKKIFRIFLCVHFLLKFYVW